MAVEPGYPIVLTHPQHRNAVLGIGNAPGFPEQFPNVTVNGVAQEAEHRARGYLCFGEAPAVKTDHHEYPKILRHPDHKDATEARVEPRVENNRIVGTFTIKGEPEVFPDVVVKNSKEESEWLEKGWKPAGDYNRRMLESVLDDSINEEEYTPTQYPRWENGILVERDPDVDYIDPDPSYPRLVNGVLIHDPRLPATLDPTQWPKWIHQNGRPSDKSELAKTPEEEAAILAKWKSEEPEPETPEAHVMPSSPASGRRNKESVA